MSDDSNDTDLKLAILASLVSPSTYSTGQYLDALLQHDGDPERAAESLKRSPSSSSSRGTKRKAAAGGEGIVGWLKGKDKKKAVRKEGDEDEGFEIEPPVKSETKPSVTIAKAPPVPKKTVDLLSILQQPTSSSLISSPQARAPPRPPIVLTTASQIAAHLPTVTLEKSPLSPELAAQLYLTIMKESESWEGYKWFLAGRAVESSHTNAMYMFQEGPPVQYYYAGQKDHILYTHPDIMKRVLDIINPYVNDILEARPYRYSLEFDGPWEANMAGCNRYDGAASSVGWHSDTMTYLGPCTTIASLSLGVTRAFRLRPAPSTGVGSPLTDTNGLRTYEIPLGHNTLCIMHAGTQERYKHTISPVPKGQGLDLFKPSWDINGGFIPEHKRVGYSSRINITFRFFRPDFHPNPGVRISDGRERDGIPLCRCPTPIPTLIRADQKGKVRSSLSTSTNAIHPTSINPGPSSPSKTATKAEENTILKLPSGQAIIHDDQMEYFYQCQGVQQTGDLKGCGFFKILDLEKEGRGPCLGWRGLTSSRDEQ